MDLSFFRNKKNITILVASSFALWGIIYLFTHSLLTVTGTGPEEKTINVLRDGGNSKTFKLTENKKTLLLRKGEYRIEVVGDQKFSSYYKNLGGFSKHNINVELQPQKKLNALGVSRFTCSKDQPEKAITIFYPCTDYSGITEIRSNGQLQTNFDPGGHDSLEHDKAEPSGEDALIFGSSLQPYGSDFLVANSSSEGLSISLKHEGGLSKPKETAKVSGFKDFVSDHTFSTSREASMGSFSILDRKRNKLLLLQNHQDASPDEVDLSKELSGDSEHRIEIIKSSGDYVFVATSQDATELEDHERLEEKSEENKRVRGKIIIVDINKKSVSKVLSLPDKYIIKAVEANPAGDLLILPLYEPHGIILLQHEKQATLDLPWQDIKEVCWKDQDNFYYSRATDGQIYLYSLIKSASFLAYSNPSSVVNNLNCDFDATSFTLSSDLDGVVGEQFVHYAFSKQDILRGRIEWALPMKLAAGEDSIRVTQERESLVVSPIFRGPPDKRLPNEKVKELIIKEFTSQGINPGDISINFAY